MTTYDAIHEKIRTAKAQLLSHPGCGCDECREARMVLRRYDTTPADYDDLLATDDHG